MKTKTDTDTTATIDHEGGQSVASVNARRVAIQTFRGVLIAEVREAMITSYRAGGGVVSHTIETNMRALATFAVDTMMARMKAITSVITVEPEDVKQDANTQASIDRLIGPEMAKTMADAALSAGLVNVSLQAPMLRGEKMEVAFSGMLMALDTRPDAGATGREEHLLSLASARPSIITGGQA